MLLAITTIKKVCIYKKLVIHLPNKIKIHKIMTTEDFNKLSTNEKSVLVVKGCGGIMQSYIFNTETRELTYLNQ
jgi:hypothetical protein